MKNRMITALLGMVAIVAVNGCSGVGGGDGGDAYEKIAEIWDRDCQMVSEERFVYETDTLLTDTLTCLEWQYLPEAGYKSYVTPENFDKGRYDDTSGDTAQSTCEALGQGWRLPTKYEALSAIIKTDADLSKIPYRKEIPSELYDRGNFFIGATWTSTPVSGHEEYRWFVEFLEDFAQTDSNRVDYASFQVFCVKEH